MPTESNVERKQPYVVVIWCSSLVKLGLRQECRKAVTYLPAILWIMDPSELRREQAEGGARGLLSFLIQDGRPESTQLLNDDSVSLAPG